MSQRRSGTAILDFTDTPSFETEVVVMGQAGIQPTSHVRAEFQGDVMSGNNENDHILAGETIELVPGIPVSNVGFTIYARSDFAAWTKRFRVRWSWTN